MGFYELIDDQIRSVLTISGEKTLGLLWYTRSPLDNNGGQAVSGQAGPYPRLITQLIFRRLSQWLGKNWRNDGV